MKGKIIKIISNDYTVDASGDLYVCKSRGKFRNQKITPLVGDEVDFDDKNNYIMEVLARKNELTRPPVSNIDQAVIIMSVKEPEFSTNLLDKLLVIIEYNNIKPIICLTKLDLLTDLEEIDDYKKYYESIGYPVYTSDHLDDFKKIFKNKVTVFTGQSGSGKSTLLNKLDIKLNLKTDVISHALGRGKHTTRHVELIKVLGGLIADTPGFSAIEFTGMSPTLIRDNFVEFNLYRDDCKYSDCMHNQELDCAIKTKVNKNKILNSRYQNYLKFIGK